MMNGKSEGSLDLPHQYLTGIVSGEPTDQSAPVSTGREQQVWRLWTPGGGDISPPEPSGPLNAGRSHETQHQSS